MPQKDAELIAKTYMKSYFQEGDTMATVSGKRYWR